MTNLNRIGSGMKLIKEIVSGQSQPNQPWSKKKQEEKLKQLKNAYSKKTR